VDLDTDVVDGDTMIDPGASAGQAPGVDVLIVSALTAPTADDFAFYGCQVSALSSPRSAPAAYRTMS
jgi:hypothetical protein